MKDFHISFVGRVCLINSILCYSFALSLSCLVLWGRRIIKYTKEVLVKESTPFVLFLVDRDGSAVNP